MKTLTVAQAQRDLYSLFEKVTSTHHPIMITSNVGDAVLISAKVYKEMTEAINSSCE
jgi:prevent-host-death family protein